MLSSCRKISRRTVMMSRLPFRVCWSISSLSSQASCSETGLPPRNAVRKPAGILEDMLDKMPALVNLYFFFGNAGGYHSVFIPHKAPLTELAQHRIGGGLLPAQPFPAQLHKLSGGEGSASQTSSINDSRFLQSFRSFIQTPPYFEFYQVYYYKPGLRF